MCEHGWHGTAISTTAAGSHDAGEVGRRATWRGSEAGSVASRSASAAGAAGIAASVSYHAEGGEGRSAAPDGEASGRARAQLARGRRHRGCGFRVGAPRRPRPRSAGRSSASHLVAQRRLAPTGTDRLRGGSGCCSRAAENLGNEIGARLIRRERAGGPHRPVGSQPRTGSPWILLGDVPESARMARHALPRANGCRDLDGMRLVSRADRAGACARGLRAQLRHVQGLRRGATRAARAAAEGEARSTSRLALHRRSGCSPRRPGLTGSSHAATRLNSPAGAQSSR